MHVSPLYPCTQIVHLLELHVLSLAADLCSMLHERLQCSLAAVWASISQAGGCPSMPCSARSIRPANSEQEHVWKLCCTQPAHSGVAWLQAKVGGAAEGLHRGLQAGWAHRAGAVRGCPGSPHAPNTYLCPGPCLGPAGGRGRIGQAEPGSPGSPHCGCVAAINITLDGHGDEACLDSMPESVECLQIQKSSVASALWCMVQALVHVARCGLIARAYAHVARLWAIIYMPVCVSLALLRLLSNGGPARLTAYDPVQA